MNAITDPVLLVEDTPSLAMIYETVLKRAGYHVARVATAGEAQRAFGETAHPIVLLDLMLPDGNGFDLLRAMMRDRPETRIIVITSNGSINRAVEAMRGGAFDFLVKPFDERRLLSAIDNAVAALNARTGRAGQGVGQEDAFFGFVGASPAMQEIYRMISNIGRSTATVFVTGESGTGKELAAHAIHANSGRAEGPFVPLNCGAIPKDLLESEVFGHLRGSFTGAIADKKGAAAAADGGTLFMDEICEMPLALQTKLLRFLQTSMIQPVGAATPRKVDVRIVCATNRDPLEEVRAGRFREDLYYRLHVVPIHLPPLRERGEDAVQISRRFLPVFAREENKSFSDLHPSVADLFRRHPWPGNVRQLLNTLRNVVVLCEGPLVRPEMLPPDVMEQSLGPGLTPDPRALTGMGAAQTPTAHTPAAQSLPAHTIPTASAFGVEHLVGMSLSEMEREFIEATIRHCNGSIPKAARLLDVSPSTLYRKRDSWVAAGMGE